MPSQSAVSPIRTTVLVEAPVERAFDVFSRGLDAWWPREYKIGAAELREAVLEPRTGGRWFERGEDGEECDWGRVIAYEPPHRLVLAWQIDGRWQFDPELLTEVEVRFTPEGEGRTRVELEHRGLDRLGDQAEGVRLTFTSPNGWPGLLGRFAAAAAG